MDSKTMLSAYKIIDINMDYLQTLREKNMQFHAQIISQLTNSILQNVKGKSHG